MIAILTDKFKGTLSGAEVADIIAALVPDSLYIPMADGGEGTAEALDATLEVTAEGDFYSFVDSDGTRTGYVPSCGEGIESFPKQDELPLRQRSSAPVGRMARHALRRYGKVYVGIGGTRTADGGLGFARELEGVEGTIVGLADVAGPLYSPNGLSALSFIAQKGATEEDRDALTQLFRHYKQQYPSADRYGAAGGGIGFAIESILGGTVLPGAKYVLHRNLSHYLKGRRPRLLITGEGCLDSQTEGGKVVDAVNRYGAEQGIPVVTFAGKINGLPPYPNVFSTTAGPVPTPEVAKMNLREAVGRALPLINSLLHHD